MTITVFKKIALVFSVGSFFVACSSEYNQDYVNLEDRVVPVESGQSSQASLDTESANEEESSVINPVSTPVGPYVSLKEKILANSDVSPKALENAFKYFDSHKNIIRNKNYMTIFDIGLHSGKPRFFMIDLKTGNVKSMHTSHGRGSDTDHDGIATSFSNVSGSNKSSLGFMLTAEEYVGKHGRSMRFDGQETRNSNVRSRAIVVHSASYVGTGFSKMGRSEGCPAVSSANIQDVVSKLKNGSLFYIYHKDQP